MALTNKGFNGTVEEADFARMFSIGKPEGVDSATSWLVTQGTGRQVSVAAQNGWAFARGVISQDTAAITANLGTPTNGQWYLIVRRINWTTDVVSVVAIAHSTTTTTIPTVAPTTYPTVSSTPGVEYDQFLAWAWVRSTDTTMVLFDLRYTAWFLNGTTRTAWLGEVTAYTPTLTNLTIGNGVMTAFYAQVGKVVSFTIDFSMGSTSAMGTSPTFSLPVTSLSNVPISFFCQMTDVGTLDYPSGAFFTTTTIAPKFLNAAGTYLSTTNPTSTVPFTWTTSDFIRLGGSYLAA